jgi:hypothetical protein
MMTPPDNRDAIVYPVLEKLDQRGVDLAIVVSALVAATLEELKFTIDMRRRAGIRTKDRAIEAQRREKVAACLALGLDYGTALRLTERTPPLSGVADRRTPDQTHFTGGVPIKQRPARTWIETARKAIRNAGATEFEAHALLIGVELVRPRRRSTRVKPAG